jgi:hypothetical protein
LWGFFGLQGLRDRAGAVELTFVMVLLREKGYRHDTGCLLQQAATFI